MSYHGQWQWQADLDLDKPTAQNNIQRPDFLFKNQKTSPSTTDHPTTSYLNSSRHNETITPGFTWFSRNEKQNAADIDHSHEHDANPDQSPQIKKI